MTNNSIEVVFVDIVHIYMILSETKKYLAKVREHGKKIGFTCSAFDILHAGHYLMLKECHEVCDFLVIGLQTDPTLDTEYRNKTGNKNKPIQSVEERRIQIEGCKYVDYIIEYSTESELIKILKEIKPDIRIIGMDWKGKEYTGHDLGIPIHFNDRSHTYSTTNIRKRIYEAELNKIRNNKTTVINKSLKNSR